VLFSTSHVVIDVLSCSEMGSCQSQSDDNPLSAVKGGIACQPPVIDLGIKESKEPAVRPNRKQAIYDLIFSLAAGSFLICNALHSPICVHAAERISRHAGRID
jgi:hypothetical protein